MTRSVDEELEQMLRDLYGKQPRPAPEVDPEFDREVAELLAEGDRVVLSGVEFPRTTPPVSGRPRGPVRARRREKFLVASLATVVIAAVLSHWTGTRDALVLSPTGSFKPLFSGAFAEYRDGARADAETAARVGSESAISIRFVEPKNKDGVPPAKLQVFRVGAQGRLQPLAATVTQVEDEGQISFTVEGKGATMFGASTGPQTVAFAFIALGADATGLAGSSFAEARARRGISWATQQVIYVGSLDSLEARLYHYVRVADHFAMFTRVDLPRVRVRGRLGDAFALRYSTGGAPPISLPVSRRERPPYLLLDVTAPPAAPGEFGELQLLLGDRVIESWSIGWARAAEDDPVIIGARQLLESGAAEQAGEWLKSGLPRGGWTRYFCELELGRLARRLGKSDEAWNWWNEAYSTARALNSETEAAARLRSLAFLDLDAARYSRARDEIMEAMNISRAAGDETGIGRAEYLQAMMLQRLNAPDAPLLARTHYSRALDAAWWRGDDDDAAIFRTMLATLIAEYEDPTTALALLNEHELPQSARLPKLELELVRAYVQRLEHERNGRGEARARRLRAEALELLNRVAREGRPSDRAHLLVYLTRYDLDLGELAEAQRRIELLEAMPEATIGEVRWIRPLLAAEVELAGGRAGAGLEARLRALQDAARREVSESLDVEIDAEVLIGDLRRSLNLPGAEQAYRAAIEGVDSLSRRFAAPRARARTRSRRAAAEQSLVSLLVAEGRAAEALALVETSRSREIIELIAQAGVTRDPAAWDRYLEQRLSHSLEAREHCPSDPTECEKREEEQVRAALGEYYSAHWGDNRLREKLPDASAAFRSLPSSSAVLSVVRLPDGLQTFWVREGKVRSARATDGDPLSPWLEELSGVTRLYVSPGDHLPAFDLAWRPMSNGEPLGAGVAVMILAHRAPPAARPASEAALLIADPDGDLPEAATEAREVARLLPGSLLLIGEDATREGVMSRWSRFAVLSFGGHARGLAGDHRIRRLDLARGTDVRFEDILADPPAAELVVLGGCATEGSDPRNIGLTAAFIAAGAGHVLATAEIVRDADARRFVRKFFEAGGVKNPAEGFRRAVHDHGEEGEAARFRLWAAFPPRR